MTSRRWRTILSLIVGLALATAQAESWSSLERSVRGLPVMEAAAKLHQSPLVKSATDLSDVQGKALIDAVRLRARVEESGSEPDQQAAVKAIKRSNGMIDGTTAEDANWLYKALQRLMNRAGTPDIKAPDVGGGADGRWLITLMWGILGVAAASFLVFAIRHLSRIQRRKVVRALVEEDEPDRTVDEWLVAADDLERQGRYREAVRALYLAILLRLDEAGVARFVRHETNWEHQRRIEASPKRPPTLDTLPATRLMDRVWYGFRTEGAPDVAAIRQIYAQIVKEAFAK